MRISDWGSDVCSSDLGPPGDGEPARGDRRQAADHAGELSGRYGRCDASSVRMAGGIGTALRPTGSKQTPIVVAVTRHSPSTNTPWRIVQEVVPSLATRVPVRTLPGKWISRTKSTRSEEHTSELQSLMRNSNAVFCLK